MRTIGLGLGRNRSLQEMDAMRAFGMHPIVAWAAFFRSARPPSYNVGHEKRSQYTAYLGGAGGSAFDGDRLGAGSPSKALPPPRYVVYCVSRPMTVGAWVARGCRLYATKPSVRRRFWPDRTRDLGGNFQNMQTPLYCAASDASDAINTLAGSVFLFARCGRNNLAAG